jgi:hypothetical protein
LLIALQSLSADEQRLFRLYGKLPNKKDLLQNKLKASNPLLNLTYSPNSLQERKYFDSGDYALSKAGKASDVGVTSIGSQHPLPENIPHLSATSPGNATSPPQNGQVGSPIGGQNMLSGFGSQSRSPVKESSFLHRGQSIDDTNTDDEAQQEGAEADVEEKKELSVSPPSQRQGMPIRRS